MSLKEKIAKYLKPSKVYDVSNLAEKEEINDEIEKALWELCGTMGLTKSEIEQAVSSINKKNS